MRALKIDYDGLPWKTVGQGVRYKPVVVDGVGASMVAFDAGVSHAPHSHPDVQIVFCLQGCLEFYVKDADSERTEVVEAGDVLALQPHVLHGARAREASLILTIWSPMSRFLEDAIVV